MLPMDLGTSAIILGMIAAAVYVLETTCKYGPAILKKIRSQINRDRVRHTQNKPFKFIDTCVWLALISSANLLKKSQIRSQENLRNSITPPRPQLIHSCNSCEFRPVC